MRSLFLKIFLWFWLGQLLMLGAFWLAQRHWAEPPALPSAAAMRALALEASQLVQRRDRAGLTAWLGELDDGSPLRFYLFDRRGRELTDRRVPGGFVKHLMERVDRPPLAHYAQRRHVAAQPLRVEGERYLLVAARSPRSRLSELPPWSRVLIAATVSASVCLLLAAYLSRPIRKVRRATQALAAGELTARVDPLPRGRDELAELSRDFNAMAERLQILIESRSQLLQDVSHELRSPLARLQVALELARQRAGSDAGASLDRIELETERLNELIAQVLTLTRMESGVRAAPADSVDLAELCREIAEDARFEAEDGRRVEVSAPTAPVVRGDAGLLRSAVENVVRNALRHTAAGTAIEIALRESAAEVEIEVRDHGPGLAEGDLQRVFDPFVRASAARERDTGGYGLGLAIAKRTMALHGGSIAAANAADGGLRVILRLPR